LQSAWLLHLTRQRRLGLLGDRFGNRHGTSSSALIAQVHPTKGGFGPLMSRQQQACMHSLLPFFPLNTSLILSPVESKVVIKSQSGVWGVPTYPLSFGVRRGDKNRKPCQKENLVR